MLAYVIEAFLGSALGTALGLWFAYCDRRKFEIGMTRAHLAFVANTDMRIARIEAHVGMEPSPRFFEALRP